MTSEPDPLDPSIRRSLDKIAIPDGLEARILESVRRRRRFRLALAAAALLVIAGSAIFFRPEPVEPTVFGPTISIAQTPPLPLAIGDVELETRVEVDGDTLTFNFNFVNGDDHYE